MKVLVALAARRGEVVSREELIDRCWNGRILGEDVINRAILLLRRIAKDSGTFAIATVPKVGYRLTETGQLSSYKWGPWCAAVAATALVVVSMFLLRAGSDQSHPPLAVIEIVPFAAAGGQLAVEAAKASDTAVSDMLVNSGQPVLASNKGQTADLRLSGQMRLSGDRVEATLHLDDLAHGTLLLSRRFGAGLDQSRSLPEQIGAFAATSLASTGALMALDRRQPGDPRLTGEVLRQWSQMMLFEDAIGTYQGVDRIAAQMPNSAVTQLGLAMTTVHALPLLPPRERAAALAKGRAAAARARVLAPDYGDVAWAECTLSSPVRMAQCEAALQKAFAIDPHAPFVAAGMRNQLVSVGRFRDALYYDRLAVAAMPYMAGRLAASTMLLENLNQRARANQQFQRLRRWWPGFDQVFAYRIEGMLDRGSIEDAASFVATMPREVDVIDRTAVAAIARDVAMKNSKAVSSRCLATSVDGSLAYFCLVAMVRAADVNGAFVLADRLFPTLMADNPNEEDRLFLQRVEPLGIGVLSTQALAPMRNDRRFIAIAERVGLMRYWKQNHLPDFCTVAHERVCNLIARH